MATVATVRTAIEAALVAQLSVAAIVTRPLSRDEKIPVGVTRASVLPANGGVHPADAQHTYVLGNYVIEIAHRLSDATDEDTYLDGNYATDQAALMLPSFFEALTGVYGVTSDPVPEEVTREGNVIAYKVSVQVAIKP